MSAKTFIGCVLVLLVVIAGAYLIRRPKEPTFVITKHDTSASAAKGDIFDRLAGRLARVANGGKDKYIIKTGSITIEATCAGEVLTDENPEIFLTNDCENAPEVGLPVKMERRFVESFQYLYYQPSANHAVRFLVISEEKQ